MKTQAEKRKQKIAQLEAKLQREKQALKEQKRKEDTRRKIVIGGAIEAAIADGVLSREKLIAVIDRYVNAERDRKLLGLQERTQENESSQYQNATN